MVRSENLRSGLRRSETTPEKTRFSLFVGFWCALDHDCILKSLFYLETATSISIRLPESLNHHVLPPHLETKHDINVARNKHS